MFDPQEFVKEKIEELRTKITGKAIIACSGGVDSTVAAVLVDRAIGERLLTVYVDTGLMRKGETEDVRRMFDNLNVHYRIVDAKDEFFAALKGQTDPEAKRKVIGEKGLRAGGPGVRRGPSGPGDHRPGLDRARRRRPGHHQEPSQRRRAAEGHDPQAGGAPLGPVQG